MPWRANRASSVVTGTRMVLVHAWPSQPGGAVCRLAEGRRGRRHRRIVDVELELEHSRTASDRDRLDRQRAITAIEEFQRPDQGRLRLDRHHARAETAKDGDTVADMGADVEHEIARLSRTGHRAGPWRRDARDRHSTGAASARRRASSARIRATTRTRSRTMVAAACCASPAALRQLDRGQFQRAQFRRRQRLLRQSVEPGGNQRASQAPARRSPPRAGSTAADRLRSARHREWRRRGDSEQRARGASPIRVCGQKCRNASDHGTS